MTNKVPLLELKGITKIYPSVVANDDIDLTVYNGEIHAVLGENGAGKSTLMKTIYGVHPPDKGEMKWQGKPVKIRNPAHARSVGIGMVFQHFSLFETLSVVENISLAVPGSIPELTRNIEEAASRFGLDINPDAKVQSLTVGERQRVEILRSILRKPKLLVLDEPTSVLSPQGIEQLFDTLRAFAKEGYGIIFISHKLDEIRELCDVATILRGGKLMGRVNLTDETNESLTRLMIGHDIPIIDRGDNKTTAKEMIRLNGLSYKPEDPFATSLEEVDMSVKAGEVVGIAGVSGNGQQTLAALLSGETKLPAAHDDFITLDGEGISSLGPAQRRKRGVHLIPEERIGRGAVQGLSLSNNGVLTGYNAGLTRKGFLSFGSMKRFAKSVIEEYDVRCGGETSDARSLSGGNLQKFIVGREISLKPKVLIVSQPTWGVDVGAAAAIRQRLLELKNEGVALIVISEELSELLEVCDRLHVIFRGRLSPSVDRKDMSVDRIGLAMTGNFDALSNQDGKVVANG